jgi:hypothetical protein
LTQNPTTFPHDTSLYLAPFHSDTISDLPTAQAVDDLLSCLSPTIRRLVIDIPLRSLYPADDSLAIRPILRKAFTQLTSLELFCSARDELFLSCSSERLITGSEANVWSEWPKLKTLALYNCDLDSEGFWRDMKAMETLETLVLTRADGLQHVDFKSEWSGCRNGDKSLTVWFVDVDNGQGIPERIEEPKEGDKVRIMAGRVPTSYYGDEDFIELCQDWIKRSALRGEAGFQEELMHLSL